MKRGEAQERSQRWPRPPVDSPAPRAAGGERRPSDAHPPCPGRRPPCHHRARHGRHRPGEGKILARPAGALRQATWHAADLPGCHLDRSRRRPARLRPRRGTRLGVRLRALRLGIRDSGGSRRPTDRPRRGPARCDGTVFPRSRCRQGAHDGGARRPPAAVVLPCRRDEHWPLPRARPGHRALSMAATVQFERGYNAAVDFVDPMSTQGVATSLRTSILRAHSPMASCGPRGARRPDAGPLRRGAGEPHRAGPARHGRFPGHVLGRDPCRRDPGAVQYAAHRRRSIATCSRIRAPRRIFVSPALLPDVHEAAQGVSTLKRSSSSAAVRSRICASISCSRPRTPGSPAATCADEVAYWLYSSGTTGMPKGVMHVHSTPRLVSQLVGAGRLGLREDDVSLLGRQDVLLLRPGQFDHLSDGRRRDDGALPGTADAADRIRDAAQLSADDILCGAHAVRVRCLADPECTPRVGSQRLRLCFSAGEPLPAQIGEAWKDALRSRHHQRRRFDRDGTSVPDQSVRTRSNTALPACRSTATSCGSSTSTGTTSPMARSANCWCAVRRRPLAIGTSATKIAPTFAGRMDAHRRQVSAPRGWRLRLLRSRRRHVQGQRHLGVAARGRSGAGRASARARGGRDCRPRTHAGLIKPKAFVVLEGSRRRPARPRAVRGAQGARQAQPSVRGSIRAGSSSSTACRGPRRGKLQRHMLRDKPDRRQLVPMRMERPCSRSQSPHRDADAQRPPVNAISSEWLALFGACSTSWRRATTGRCCTCARPRRCSAPAPISSR